MKTIFVIAWAFLIASQNALAMATDTLPYKPDRGYYFIRRTDKIDSSSFLFYPIKRSFDKKDVADTTITLSSYGEGWLDKDSVPVGEWKFYSKDEKGKEYVLKEGVFRKTTSDLFDIVGDIAEIKELFRLSPDTLRVMQSARVRYIKCGTWVYYHPNGKIWKKQDFLCNNLPVEYSIVVNENGSKELLVTEGDGNFGADEYIDFHSTLSEYDEAGRIFKKLKFFYLGNRAIYKAIYDKHGNIVKEIADQYGVGPFNQ